MTEIATADLPEDQRQAVEIVGHQFARGARNVAIDAAAGFRVLQAVTRHLAGRAARGQRCLVLNPMPGMRLHDVRSGLPETTVGTVGAGAMVEVAGYREAERILIHEHPRGPRLPYDLVVIEFCHDFDRHRARAVRDAVPSAEALLVGSPAPRAVCDLDAVVSRKQEGPDRSEGALPSVSPPKGER